MLRKGVVVEVELDHIVVRITATSYAASYYRMDNAGLVARNLPLRDDHRAPMTRLEFIRESHMRKRDPRPVMVIDEGTCQLIGEAKSSIHFHVR
jgi:hypothetical protein